MNNSRLQSVQKHDQYAMSIKIQRKQIYKVPILHSKKKNKVSKKIFFLFFTQQTNVPYP